MPLFAYFSVVGTLLVGLLFVADIAFGPAPPMTLSTNFHGLPQRWKSPPVILAARDLPPPILTVSATPQAAAPLPQTAAPSTTLSATQASAFAQAANSTKVAGKHKTKKTKVAHHKPKAAKGVRYASQTQQSYGAVW